MIFKNEPWRKHLTWARARCNYKTSGSYYKYGGRGIKCCLEKEEIKTIWFRDRAQRMAQPSLDRIDPAGHYSFANCRFLENSENSMAGAIKNRRRVDQMSISGEKIKTHKSLSDAYREVTGRKKNAPGKISHCCIGINKTAYGFKWRYSK